MEEQAMINAENFTLNDVLERIVDFPLKPLRRKLIVTINTAEDVTEDGIRTSSNELAETQYVMAVGDHISELKPGNKVLLNLERMSVRVPNAHDMMSVSTQIKLRPVEVNGRLYALIDDGDVDCVDFRNDV